MSDNGSKNSKQERLMKSPGSAKKASDGHEAVTDDNPCAVQASDWTSSPSVQSLCNKASKFMLSRPVATLWSRIPFRFELLLFAMAASVRFYDLHYPDSVVFDEYHFGAFVNKYNWGKYFFDIHPPLGKLTLLWVGKLTGYDADTCSYDSIHDVYADNCKYMILRNVAAFFGCLLPPCLFSIAKKMGMSNSVAFLVGSLSVFDSMEVVESRHILVDSQLMFYCGLSLWFALKYWDALERNLPSVQELNSHMLWLLGIGVTCSTALSIKWTTLATPGMIAVESFMAVFFIRTPVNFGYLLGVLAVIIALYSFWWAIHFWYLPLSGDGDGFMPMEFQKTLVNGTHYEPNAPGMGFWDLLYELNREMYSASARIDSPHHWESKHYQWITNARGVLYWAIDDKALYETRGQVYILGNPAVSWGCGLAVLAFLVLNAIRQRLRLTGSTGTTASPAASRLLHAGWFCFFAYLFNLLPYLGVTRQAFIYHYMPALMYAMLIAGCVLQWQFKQETLDRVVVPVALLVVIVTFIRYAPWIYAFPLPNEAHENRRWMSSWT